MFTINLFTTGEGILTPKQGDRNCSTIEEPYRAQILQLFDMQLQLSNSLAPAFNALMCYDGLLFCCFLRFTLLLSVLLYHAYGTCILQLSSLSNTEGAWLNPLLYLHLPICRTPSLSPLSPKPDPKVHVNLQVQND